MRRFRQCIAQLEKHGIRFRCYDLPHTDELIERLREVSNEWLTIPGKRERRFTLGQFDADYIRTTPVFAVEESDGRIVAFVNLISSYRPGEVSVDLMRHRLKVPNATMDYLFVKLFLLCKDRGLQRFDLGMSPMSGFHESEQPTAVEKAVHSCFQHMNFLFSFRGLNQFKSKFADYWEPRYVVFRNVMDLPKFGLALSRISESRQKVKVSQPRFGLIGLGVFLLAISLSTTSFPQPTGRNTFMVRGVSQDLYYYPSTGPTLHRKVLFIPGDGGWRGWAITLAQLMSSWGYDVYGLDTKTYLSGFTSGGGLRDTDVMSDFREIARWINRDGGGRITLVGWSEGAGLGVLAAAPAENKAAFNGLITFGLGDENVLGWCWKDDITYVTRTRPVEPSFRARAYVARIAPLPFLMLQSSNDEYVPADEAKMIAAAARDPKRLSMIQATNHRFGGNTSEFYRQLREGLQWIR